MFRTKISRLQEKSAGLLNSFTVIVEGLREANISASKEIDLIADKVAKLSNDEIELIKLKQANEKIIVNINKIIQ